MKKVERWRENKVRKSKVSENKCWLLIKIKWFHYYETYQNDKMTLLLWNGGSTTV